MRRFLTLLVTLVVFGVGSALAQTKQVSGKVVGADDNQPIIGASVLIKEAPTVGTVTDIDGNYTLKNVPANAKTIVFRFVGYQTLEMPITGATINASLSPDTQKIEEVVVTAYGTVKKSSMTSSAAVVGAKELASRPVSNAMKAIEGQAAGVQVTPGYGAPGSAPTIRVRGFGSINASSDPLYVVDGIPFDGGIGSLNTDDIESLTVLKDAAATSLYGSRAANGVVIITTKKGKNEQFNVNAKVNYGVSSRGIPEYDRIGALDYYPTIWSAIKNGNSWGQATWTASKTWTPGVLPTSGTGSEAAAIAKANSTLISTYLKYNILTLDGINKMDNTQIVGADGKINPAAKILPGYTDLDWFKELSRLGTRKDYSVSASGGTAKSDYYFSLGYLNEEGYVLNSDYERLTARSAINVKPTSWLKMGSNIAGTVVNSKQITGDANSSSSYRNPFYFARNIGPIYPVYLHNFSTGAFDLDKSGNKIYDYGQNGNRGSGASAGRNVLAELLWNSDKYRVNSLDSKAYADILLPYNFKFSVNGGYTIRNYADNQYDNQSVGDGAPAGRLSQSYNRTTSITLNELLNWNKSFGSNSVDVLLGHEIYDYRYNMMNGSKQGQIVTNPIYEFPNFTELSDMQSREDKNRIESYFSRVNYNYAEKYFVSGSLRRDGSSRFESKKQWGNFFSASLAWNATREEFIKNISWINELKVRASYGETGNNDIGSFYPYQDLFNLGYNNGMNSAGGILQTLALANSNITWETNKQSNIAVDFKFYNRISGSIEWFNRESDNLLFDVPQPLSTGRNVQPQNIGTMYNRGVEATINGTILNMPSGFTWNASFNATMLTNKITKMPVESPTIVQGTKQLAVGHSIYDFYLRQWAGVDPRDGSSLYVYDSERGDASFNEAGNPYSFRTIDGKRFTTDPNFAKYDYCGSSIPDVYGGITNTFSYKGISLSVLLSYSIGGKGYDGAYASLMSYGAGSALHPDILKSWQKPGDNTDIPRIDITKNSFQNAASSRWLIDADYLALKNVTLGYTFPAKLVNKVGLKGLSAFFSGDNLALLTKRKGFNPQNSFAGTTNNTYVMSKVYTFGVNVNL